MASRMQTGCNICRYVSARALSATSVASFQRVGIPLGARCYSSSVPPSEIGGFLDPVVLQFCYRYWRTLFGQMTPIRQNLMEDKRWPLQFVKITGLAWLTSEIFKLHPVFVQRTEVYPVLVLQAYDARLQQLLLDATKLSDEESRLMCVIFVQRKRASVEESFLHRKREELQRIIHAKEV